MPTRRSHARPHPADPTTIPRPGRRDHALTPIPVRSGSCTRNRSALRRRRRTAGHPRVRRTPLCRSRPAAASRRPRCPSSRYRGSGSEDATMCSTAGTALMFEWLNREERGLVERRLPRDAPSRRLIAVTEATRGGALWLVAAAALALRPGLCRVGARDAAIAVAAASGLANLTRRLLVRRRRLETCPHIRRWRTSRPRRRSPRRMRRWRQRSRPRWRDAPGRPVWRPPRWPRLSRTPGYVLGHIGLRTSQ